MIYKTYYRHSLNKCFIKSTLWFRFLWFYLKVLFPKLIGSIPIKYDENVIYKKNPNSPSDFVKKRTRMFVKGNFRKQVIPLFIYLIGTYVMNMWEILTRLTHFCPPFISRVEEGTVTLFSYFHFYPLFSFELWPNSILAFDLL